MKGYINMTNVKTNTNTKAIFNDIADERYVQALTNLWESAMDLVTYSNKQNVELYRLAQIVRFFAYGKAKIENLRRTIDIAKEQNDVATLQRLAYQTMNLQSEKAIANTWLKVSEEYDEVLESILGEQDHLDNMILTHKTSADILKDCMKATGSYAGKDNIQSLAEKALANLNF